MRVSDIDAAGERSILLSGWTESSLRRFNQLPSVRYDDPARGREFLSTPDARCDGDVVG